MLVVVVSVHPSTGWSAHPSARPSILLMTFWAKRYLNRINAPALPYATNAVVYTNLFLKTRSENGYRLLVALKRRG